MVSLPTPLPSLETAQLPPELVPIAPAPPPPPPVVAPSRPRKSSRRRPSRAVGVDSSSDVGDSSSTSLERDSEVSEILGTEVREDAKSVEAKDAKEAEVVGIPVRFGSPPSIADSSMLGVQDLRALARSKRRRKNEEEMRAKWGSTGSLRTYTSGRSGRSGSSGESLYEDASAGGMSSTDEDDEEDVALLLDPSRGALAPKFSPQPPHRPSPPRRTASDSTLSGSIYSFGEFGPKKVVFDEHGSPSLDKSTPRNSPRRRISSLQTYSSPTVTGLHSDYLPGTLSPSLFVQAPSPSVTPSDSRSRSPLTILTPKSSPPISSPLTAPPSPQKTAWRPRPLFLNPARSFTPETSPSSTVPPSPSSSSVGVVSPVSSPTLAENANWPALSPSSRQMRSIGYFTAQQQLQQSAGSSGYEVGDEGDSSSDGEREGMERERTASAETGATSESSRRSSRSGEGEGEGKGERESGGKEEERDWYDSVEIEQVSGVETGNTVQEKEEEQEQGKEQEKEEEEVAPVQVVQALSLRSVRGFLPTGTPYDTRRLPPTPPIKASPPSSRPPSVPPRDVRSPSTTPRDQDHLIGRSPTPSYFPPHVPAVTTEDESDAMVQAGASAQARRSTMRKTYSKSTETTPVEAPIATFPSRTIKFDSPPPVVRERGASTGSQPFPPAVFKSRHVTLKGLAIWPPPDTGDPRAYRAGNRISATWNETRISSPMFLPPFRDPNGVEMPGEKGARDPRSIVSPDMAMRQFLAANQPPENEPAANEEQDQSVDSHSSEQSVNKVNKFSKRFLSSFLPTARRPSKGSPDLSSFSPRASLTSTPSSKPSFLAGSDYEVRTVDTSTVFPTKPRPMGMRVEPIEGDRPQRDSTYSTSGSSGRLSPHLFPLPPGLGTQSSESPPSSNSIHRMQAEHLQAKSSQSTLDSYRSSDLVTTTTSLVFPSRPGAEYKKEQPRIGGVFPTTSKKLKPMVLPPSAALREAMRAQSESLDV